MLSGSHMLNKGAQETNSSPLPFDPRAGQESKLDPTRERFSLISEGTSKVVPSLPLRGGDKASLQAARLGGVQDDLAAKSGSSLTYLSQFLKENGFDNSQVLNFLRKERLSTPNDSILNLISTNAFMKEALSSDLASFMNKPMPLQVLAEMFDIKEALATEASGSIDLNEQSTPGAFLKSLGIDPHLVMAKLFQIKHVLTAEAGSEKAKRHELDLSERSAKSAVHERAALSEHENFSRSAKDRMMGKEKPKKTDYATLAQALPGASAQASLMPSDTQQRVVPGQGNSESASLTSLARQGSQSADLASSSEKRELDTRESIEKLLKSSANFDHGLASSQSGVPRVGESDKPRGQENSTNPKPGNQPIANLLSSSQFKHSDRVEDFWNLDKEVPPEQGVGMLINKISAENSKPIQQMAENTNPQGESKVLTLARPSHALTAESSESVLESERGGQALVKASNEASTAKADSVEPKTALGALLAKSDKHDSPSQDTKDEKRHESPSHSLNPIPVASGVQASENLSEDKDISSTGSSSTPGLAKHVVEHAKVLLAKGGGSIVIDLPHDGPEKVSLAVKVDGHSASLKILTSSNEMKSLLGQDFDHIKQALSNIKMSLDHYEVNSIPRGQLSHFFDRNFQGQNQQQLFSSQHDADGQSWQKPASNLGNLSRVVYNASRFIPSYSRFQTVV